MSNPEPRASSFRTDQPVPCDLAAAYRLLGRLWREEPDERMLRWLSSEPVRSTYQLLSGYALDLTDALCEELQSAYCSTFLLPGKARPAVQSVFEGGQYDTEIAAETARFYDLIGYEPPCTRHRVPPDHLGIELDCAGYLLSVLSARSPADNLLRDTCTCFYERFLSWAIPYCELLTTSDRHPFYQGLARATSAAVQLWPHFIEFAAQEETGAYR